MRYPVLTLFFLGTLCTNIWGQSMKVADKQFSLHAYQSALSSYLGLHKEDPQDAELMLRIARCYYLLGQYGPASDWYQQAGSIVQDSESDLTWFARSRMMNGNYASALDLWADLEPADPVVAQQGIRSCEYALAQNDKVPAALVKRELINSPRPEFGPWWYDGQLFFSAFNPHLDHIPSGWVQGDQYHYLMSSSPDGNGFLYPPRAVRKGVRPTPNEGPVTYAPDGRLVIFMRQNNPGYARMIPEAGFQSNLFMADVSPEGLWENIRPFPYNGVSYSCAWPSIASNGQDLYFASDREGGLGGFDIYVCHRQDDGWSEPVNLGDPVNTPGNELTPHMVNQSLVFASDWHIGFGGFDLFKAFRFGQRFNRVINLGKGLNSSADDMGFILTQDPVKGYLVSNRSGQGDLDIYQFRYQLVERHIQVADAISGQPVPGATLDMSPCGGIVQHSDDNGMVHLQLTEIPSCDVLVQKSGYSPVQYAALDMLTAEDVLTIRLIPDQWNFPLLIQDANNHADLPNTLVRVTEQRSGTFRDLYSDDQGKLRVALQPDMTYFINVTREGYLNESLTIRLENGPVNPFSGPLFLKPAGVGDELHSNPTVADVPLTETKLPAEPGFAIQVASLKNGTDADVRPFERLARFGTVYQKQDAERVRIRVGLFSSREEAQRVLKPLSEMGYPDAFVVEETVESLLDKVMLSMARDRGDQKFATGEYMVRLAAYQNPRWFDPANLGSYGSITEEIHGAWTVKFIRGIASVTTAREALQAAREAGFAESYILFERNGSRNRIDE